jgi:hypothetical protein
MTDRSAQQHSPKTLGSPAPSTRTIRFKTMAVTSLIGGFLLIPFHEFGHLVCDWITGHPAAMSYARDYLLFGGKTPFLGLLGGPLFPLLLSAISIICIYRGTQLSVFYPLAVLGTLDRLLLYIYGSTPSDEKDLAHAMAWPTASFKYIFLTAEVLFLVLILLSLFKYNFGIGRSILVFAVPLSAFVVCASLGVFVVDRFVFPQQHNIEFGVLAPILGGFGSRCSLSTHSQRWPAVPRATDRSRARSRPEYRRLLGDTARGRKKTLTA